MDASSPSQCPVCRSPRLETLHTFSAGQAAQHFVLIEENPDRHRALAAHIEALWGAGQCCVLQCKDCDFGFSDPFVAGDAAFYNLAYMRASYPLERWEYTRTIAALTAEGFHANRVLEVGSGCGFFLDKLAGSFVPAQGITALEFNDNAIGKLRAKGYAAIQSDVREANLEPGFDAVFMFQVLEHIDQIHELFARLHVLVREGGLVFLSVPNQESITFNERNGSLFDMPPNHIGRYSQRALKAIGDQHGLTLERVEVESFNFKSYMLRDISYSYGRAAQQAGTLANWSRSLRSAPFGKLIGVATAAVLAPRRIFVWNRAAKAHLGGSFWAQYRKTGS